MKSEWKPPEQIADFKYRQTAGSVASVDLHSLAKSSSPAGWYFCTRILTFRQDLVWIESQSPDSTEDE